MRQEFSSSGNLAQIVIFCPIKTIFKPFNNNKNNQNMETKKYYEAPETTLVDFQAEGILCGSQGTGSVIPHEYGDWEWE